MVVTATPKSACEIGGMATDGMVLGPGGAAAGAQVGKQFGGAIAGDVAKRAYAPIHDKGSEKMQQGVEAVSEKAGDMKDTVEGLIDEKIKQRFKDEEETGKGESEYR